MKQVRPAPLEPTSLGPLGLGLDAGGTQTRWALARSGELVAEGQVPGLSGMQLASAEGVMALRGRLASLAQDLAAYGPIGAVEAGITGLPDSDLQGILAMKQMLAEALGIEAANIRCRSDIHMAWHAAFDKPGAGYLVYAGTGSMAAFVDAQGQLHRAGGRGLLLGDEGSGGWIAAQAMAEVWRLEDAQPGSAVLDSAMARALFAAVGSSDWPSSRAFVYNAARGQLGQLAIAVAATAEQDPRAAALLLRAGQELARLAQALIQRFGPRPIVVAGRVLRLSPLIEQGLREQMCGAADQAHAIELQQLQQHRRAALAAAQCAAQEASPV